MFHPVHLILILCILCLLVSPAAFADEVISPSGDAVDSTEVVTLPVDPSESPSADTLPSDAPSEPTEPSVIYVTEAPTEPVYMDVIAETGSALMHSNLFGAFLICGTLVGLFLLRGRYGT